MRKAGSELVMKVVKFGGTSVGTPEAIDRLIGIVDASGFRIVVVSAFSGVTDSLVKAARHALAGDASHRTAMAELKTRHMDMAGALIPESAHARLNPVLDAIFSELEGVLLGISLLHELSPRALDLVMSFGERLSSTIIAEAFVSRGISAEAVDSRAFIKTDDNFGQARYLEAETKEAVLRCLAAPERIQVVTGFIGSTLEGVTTTLGRGGSDFTAGILGASLGADEIQIFTDVDGIMTADPRLVPEAFLMEEITYEEALELTHFGAKVLHPPTVRPAMSAGIPIRIRSSFKPECPGTRIAATAKPSPHPVRGVASIKRIELLRLQGSGMIGVKGIAGRLFGCLATAGVNVILISQASSEHSICFAVSPEDAAKSVHAVKREFAIEMKAGLIDPPASEKDLCVIAAVGENMKSRPGISGRLFGALGRNGVNIVAIAQGSSELNISVVVASRDEGKALIAVHTAFFLSETRAIKLFLVGTGTIGGTMLAQLAAQRKSLLASHKIRIDLVGLCNSKSMAIKPHGIDPVHWRDTLGSGEPTDLRSFVSRMKALNMPDSVFCDCTASDVLPEYYEEVLKAAVAIVTPNKRANAGPAERYHILTGWARENGIPYRYETTVGAGLPIIGPLQDLVACGDRVRRIEAVLSGTISYILNSFTEGKRFSALVREAKALGYTEPDPRDDLSAADAARKTLILAREMGMQMSFSDIVIDPILPAECFEAPTVEEFYVALERYDDEFERRRRLAQEHGAVLRYVSLITEDGRATLGFREATPSDPFHALVGTENMVVYTTDRYSKLPLVVKGPGAGAEVTAGGVFADIVRIARAGA